MMNLCIRSESEQHNHCTYAGKREVNFTTIPIDQTCLSGLSRYEKATDGTNELGKDDDLQFWRCLMPPWIVTQVRK